jgi:hypothetical protein
VRLLLRGKGRHAAPNGGTSGIMRALKRGVLVAGILAVSLAKPAAAQEPVRPSTRSLLLAGAAMAPPTYVLFVGLHEGTHAVWARALGAQDVSLHLMPAMRAGHFYFGYTEWRGEMSRGKLAAVLTAPKLTDGVLFGAYGLLLGLGALPSNAYGALALTVLATGAWVDFSMDILAFTAANDMLRVYALYGRTTEWQRLPCRLVHAVVSAAGAFVLYQGYRQVFDRPRAMPMMLPVVGGAF